MRATRGLKDRRTIREAGIVPRYVEDYRLTEAEPRRYLTGYEAPAGANGKVRAIARRLNRRFRHLPDDIAEAQGPTRG